nr:S26 family signal peptidase [Pseudonocardia acidicola]
MGAQGGDVPSFAFTRSSPRAPTPSAADWGEDTLGRLRRVAVRGPSMSPTLGDGDVVLVRFGGVVRPGDVVLVRWPARPQQLSVKRAVRADGPGWWVLGDNPCGSTDSRQLGPAEVLAVVRGRLWPRPGRLRGPASGVPSP